MRTRAIALLAAAALGVGACGDDDSANGGAGATATTGAAANLDISTDLSSKPKIPKPSGKPPTKLVMRDVVVGKGRAAKAGDSVVVHYVGVTYDDAKQFDASWDRGSPFAFPDLGQAQVIAGWNQGVQGMRIGGRRLLIIPPALAYPQGNGPIGPDDTLIFVVDLLNTGPAS